MEKLLFALLIATAIMPLLIAMRRQFGRVWPALGMLTLSAMAMILWEPGGDLDLDHALPGEVEERGFVGSEACRSCHPEQYASWFASYHRTMTQPATPETVLGSFDQVRLEDRGEVYNLERRGDEFWVEMKALWQTETADGRDLSLLPHLPRVQQRVFMTTGSHHLQAYWIQVPEFNGMFFQLPWYYHIAEQRWIPGADSFLKPPVTTPERTIMWNQICLDCHTVGGEPQMRVNEGTIFSRVAATISVISRTPPSLMLLAWSRHELPTSVANATVSPGLSTPIPGHFRAGHIERDKTWRKHDASSATQKA